jgi:hypothetical protein
MFNNTGLRLLASVDGLTIAVDYSAAMARWRANRAWRRGRNEPSRIFA